MGQEGREDQDKVKGEGSRNLCTSYSIDLKMLKADRTSFEGRTEPHGDGVRPRAPLDHHMPTFWVGELLHPG